jgi:hypothetical protein
MIWWFVALGVGVFFAGWIGERIRQGRIARGERITMFGRRRP